MKRTEEFALALLVICTVAAVLVLEPARGKQSAQSRDMATAPQVERAEKPVSTFDPPAESGRDTVIFSDGVLVTSQLRAETFASDGLNEVLNPPEKPLLISKPLATRMSSPPNVPSITHSSIALASAQHSAGDSPLALRAESLSDPLDGMPCWQLMAIGPTIEADSEQLGRAFIFNQSFSSQITKNAHKSKKRVVHTASHSRHVTRQSKFPRLAMAAKKILDFITP